MTDRGIEILSIVLFNLNFLKLNLIYSLLNANCYIFNEDDNRCFAFVALLLDLELNKLALDLDFVRYRVVNVQHLIALVCSFTLIRGGLRSKDTNFINLFLRLIFSANLELSLNY